MRELLQMALNALECHTQQTRPIHNTELAIDALRAALARPESSPVLWVQNPKVGFWFLCNADEPGAIPLYAAPQAQPLDGHGGNLDSAFDWGTPHDASGAPWPDAAPAVRESLSDKQLAACVLHTSDPMYFGKVDANWLREFSRAVERAVLAAAVPPGYVVVPRDPTEMMTLAGVDSIQTTGFVEDIYTAMINAAPETKP